MSDLDKKLIDAVLFTIVVVGVLLMVYRVAACNEYQSRLTGKAKGLVRVQTFCADPPCVERVDPGMKPKGEP